MNKLTSKNVLILAVILTVVNVVVITASWQIVRYTSPEQRYLRECTTGLRKDLSGKERLPDRVSASFCRCLYNHPDTYLSCTNVISDWMATE